MKERRVCKCGDFHKNISKKLVDAVATARWIAGANVEIDLFSYCPYCGKELQRITD